MSRVLTVALGGLVASILLVSCGTSVRQAAGPIASGPAGTYELLICRGECDLRSAAGALVRGRLVLEEHAYALGDVSEPAQGYFRRYEPYLTFGDAGSMPNACFVLRMPRPARTYAGSSPVGLTKWKPDSAATIKVPLYHSPDAGYVATLSIRNGEIRGRGRSWGSEHAGDGTIPPDSIVGRRLGPPDRALCIRAAEAEAARPR